MRFRTRHDVRRYLGEAVAHQVEFGEAEQTRVGLVALDGFGSVELRTW